MGILILLFLGIACDTCDTGTNGNGSKVIDKIYYSAIVVNNSSSAIYTIDKNLTKTSLLLDSAFLYSTPSDNGYMAYLSNEIINNNTKKALYLFDLTNGSTKLISYESSIFGLYSPILSPDASLIAINSGDDKLIIYNNNNAATFNLISTNFHVNSNVSFSPDSKMMAFVEKVNANLFKVKVIDAKNNSSIATLFEKNYPINDNNTNFLNFFSWDKNSNNLFFALNKSDSSFIYQIDLTTKEEKQISFSSANIKFYDFVISPNSKYACFSNIDGNIWLVHLIKDNYKFYKISNLPAAYISFAPRWSNDANKVLFSMRRNDANQGNNILMLADIKYEPSVQSTAITLISNNVTYGFIK
ncbi:MAG TPA: hypothetical protein PLE30_09140 [Candidatus Kapabacteria bacterium]|nr:hypothetical protein [Candidatus Kapabacteria bacterium]